MWWGLQKKTEAEIVKREVDRKKKIAQEEGLDQLFSAVYHECIRNWPAWMKDEKKRKLVYPGVREARETVVKDPQAGDLQITEFSIADKKYKITDRRRGSFVKNDIFFDLELFLNGEKIFALSEYEEVKTSGTDYYPFNIDAYVNEEWVNDFVKIAQHKEELDKQKETGPAEDPETLKRLKKDFNIRDFPDAAIAEKLPKLPPPTRESFWLNWWAWLIIIFIMLFMLYLKVRLGQ